MKALSINQEGEAYYLLQAAVAGWTAFCAANPTFPLVTETGDTSIAMSPQLMADMIAVNNEVNNRFTYKSDKETYAVLENWTTMSPGASGDCEDFALTKAKKLLDLGYPASAIKIEIGITQKGVGHAWLVVQTSKGDYALDTFRDIKLNAELPYTARRRQTGPNWSAPTIILRGVPIEYMGGIDAAAFFPKTSLYSGDRAIVEFANQEWATRKVIGFEANPRSAQVCFFIGKETSPFSEYARATVSARVLRYFGVGPSANLNSLSDGSGVKTLILPCPIRVLTDAEKNSIALFRGRGGRVALFAGDNRDKANQVLEQLSSKLEIMPTRFAPSGIYNWSGYMVEQGSPDGAPTMFWIPARIRGWINVRQAYWNTARLKDFSDFGLAYNGYASAMMYETFLVAATSAGYPLGFNYIHESAIIGPQSPDGWTVAWYQYPYVFPAGYVAAYTADKAAWRTWLAANSANLPWCRVASYGYTIPKIGSPYGDIWNLDDMRDSTDMFGALIAYHRDENLVVAAIKLDYFTDDVGNPNILDYYFYTREFADWLSTGLMPIHDFFQNGNTFQPWPPYVPLFSNAPGWPDGSGAVIQSP